MRTVRKSFQPLPFGISWGSVFTRQVSGVPCWKTPFSEKETPLPCTGASQSTVKVYWGKGGSTLRGSQNTLGFWSCHFLICQKAKSVYVLDAFGYLLCRLSSTLSRLSSTNKMVYTQQMAAVILMGEMKPLLQSRVSSPGGICSQIILNTHLLCIPLHPRPALPRRAWYKRPSQSHWKYSASNASKNNKSTLVDWKRLPSEAWKNVCLRPPSLTHHIPSNEIQMGAKDRLSRDKGRNFG